MVPNQPYGQPAGRQPTPPTKKHVDAGKLWTGGLATALVAALVAIVGVVIARGIFHVALLAPKGEGTWGDVSTVQYAVAAFVAALLATGLLHLLLLATPQPLTFFGWIVGLLTLVVALAPFATGAALASKVATGLINLAVGIAIGSLLAGAARRSMRWVPPPQQARPTYGQDPRRY